MRKVCLLFTSLIAACLIGGCGDSPSTQLAPDKPLPDTSKMSDAEIQKLHEQASAGGSDRAGGNSSKSSGPPPGVVPGQPGAGRPGNTPGDRGG